MSKSISRTVSPDSVFGMLAYTGKPKSLEEMESGAMAEAMRNSSWLRKAKPPSVPPCGDDTEDRNTP